MRQLVIGLTIGLVLGTIGTLNASHDDVLGTYSYEDLRTGRAYTNPDPITGYQRWETMPGGPAYKEPC